MKKLIAITLVSVIAVILSGCAEVVNAAKSMQAVKNCNYTITSVTPEVKLTYPLSRSSVDLVLDVKVDNPNDANINLTKLGFTLLVNDTQVYKGKTDYNVAIAAKSSGVIKLRSQFYYNDIQNTFVSLARSISDQKASYRVDGTAYFDTVIGEMEFPVTITKGELTK